MKRIPLSQGKVALIDDADFDLISDYTWCAARTPNWYAVTGIYVNKKVRIIRMHRLIIRAAENEDVDHVDGNGLNNQRNNLRTCTQSQNSANAKLPKSNTSGFKGIYFNKSRGLWIAQIRRNGKNFSLGCHHTPEAAARAYDEAAVNLFGEFALTNSKLGLLCP